MKRIAYLLVCVMLIFVAAMSFSSCKKEKTDEKNSETSAEKTADTSVEEPETKPSETPIITGNWQGTVDITSAVTDAIDAVNPGMKQYMDMGTVKADYSLVLNEDGTYKFSVDKSALDKQIKSIEDALLTAHQKYLDHVIEAHGLHTTVEDYLLENDNMTLEEETAVFIERCDFSRLSAEKSGAYKYENGRLSFGKTAETVGPRSFTVKLEAKTLTFESYSEAKYSIFNMSNLLPVKFNKQ